MIYSVKRLSALWYNCRPTAAQCRNTESLTSTDSADKVGLRCFGGSARTNEPCLRSRIMAKGDQFPAEWRTFTDQRTGIEVRQLTSYKCHNHHVYFTNAGWYDHGRKLLFG